METTLTSKGQITLPKALRDALHLKTGDRVAFVLDKNGAYLRPRTMDVRKLKGIVKYNGPPLSLEEIDEAIGRGAAGLIDDE